MSKKVLVILGHPDKDSYCSALAEAYIKGAEAGGAEVRYIRIGDLNFDPILHYGYKVIQELEPDLIMFQQSIKWAEHVVFVYPTWWGTQPALLKGLIDRTFLPSFAFHYRKHLPLQKKLLAGRSAHLIYTMDTFPWYYHLVYRDVGFIALGKTVLGYSGFRPVRRTVIGSLLFSNQDERTRWLAKVWEEGRRLV